MRRLFTALWLIWKGELPEVPVEAAVRHTDCCAFLPRCKVGARSGHIAAVHGEVMLLVHFDDGEYGVRHTSEVEHLFERERV